MFNRLCVDLSPTLIHIHRYPVLLLVSSTHRCRCTPHYNVVQLVVFTLSLSSPFASDVPYFFFPPFPPCPSPPPFLFRGPQIALQLHILCAAAVSPTSFVYTYLPSLGFVSPPTIFWIPFSFLSINTKCIIAIQAFFSSLFIASPVYPF
jgi:hypothetical protein